MPNRDHNDELLQALETLPAGRDDQQPFFSVFAADPFINGKRLAKALLAKRYRRVVNWPTTGQYGAEYVATLDSVNLGPRQECQTLQHLARQGLAVGAAVALPESVEPFLELKLETLFVTPGFELWKKNKLDAAGLLRSCLAIAAIVSERVPIILMSDDESIALDDARRAGASALLTA